MNRSRKLIGEEDAQTQTHSQNVAQAQFRAARVWITVALLVVPAGLTLAAVLDHAWYAVQFRRMGWFRSATLLSSEAIALFWCLRFLVLHGLLGRPLRVQQATGRAPWNMMLMLILTISIGSVYDGVMSVRFLMARAQRYAQADRVPGSVVSYVVHESHSSETGRTIFYDTQIAYEYRGQPCRFSVQLEFNPRHQQRQISQGIQPVWDYQPGLLDKFQSGLRPPLPIQL